MTLLRNPIFYIVMAASALGISYTMHLTNYFNQWTHKVTWMKKACEALEKYADEKEWYQGGRFDMEYCYEGSGHILAQEALKAIRGEE